MAEKAEIEVVIGADGTVKIKTHGLRGESCVEETKALEQALGKVERREKTREYYEQAVKAGTGVKNR
jgi:DUF2997 family protein